MRTWPNILSAIAATVLASSTAVTTTSAIAADKQKPMEAATPTAEEKRPIIIGLEAPLSGVGANDGQLIVKGFQLYLDQIGHKMAGRPVEFKPEDDQGHMSMAVSKFRKLVKRDKADVVSGVLFTPLAYALAPVADELQVPLVISVSAADDISQRQRRKWVIRTGFTSSQISQPLGEYAAKKLGYKRIATIGSDYGHPWEVVAGFQKTFEENGGQVIQKFWVSMDQTDFSSVIKKISPTADSVLLCLVGKPSEYIPKELKHIRPDLHVLGCTTSFEESILQKVGPELVGAISSNFYSAALASKDNERFVKLYREKFGDDPCLYSECAYTSAMWIHQAVEAVHGNVEDKEKFLAALKQVQLQNAPRGPIKLDSYGTVVENIYIRRVDKVGDRYQNTVIYTYPMVSQFWKSKPEEFLKNPVFSKDYPPCTHCLPN